MWELISIILSDGTLKFTAVSDDGQATAAAVVTNDGGGMPTDYMATVEAVAENSISTDPTSPSPNNSNLAEATGHTGAPG